MMGLHWALCRPSAMPYGWSGEWAGADTRWEGLLRLAMVAKGQSHARVGLNLYADLVGWQS
jgi:hypothetical protein